MPNETFGILKDKMTRIDNVSDIKRENAFSLGSKRDCETCVWYILDLEEVIQAHLY